MYYTGVENLLPCPGDGEGVHLAGFPQHARAVMQGGSGRVDIVHEQDVHPGPQLAAGDLGHAEGVLEVRHALRPGFGALPRGVHAAAEQRRGRQAAAPCDEPGQLLGLVEPARPEAHVAKRHARDRVQGDAPGVELALELAVGVLQHPAEQGAERLVALVFVAREPGLHRAGVRHRAAVQQQMALLALRTVGASAGAAAVRALRAADPRDARLAGRA